MEEVERRGDGLPRERAAGADQLDDHQDQTEELADRAEPRGQCMQDRHERERREDQEPDGQPRMRRVDAEAEGDRGEDERRLDRAEEGRGQPTAQRDPERRLQRRQRPR